MILNHLPILLSLFILTGFVSSQALAQGVLLNAGDSYVFEFSSLLPQDTSGSGNRVFARFTTNSIGGSEPATMRLTLFDDSLADKPFQVDWPVGRYEDQLDGQYWAFVFATPASRPFWPDLQGVIRVTMLTGQAELVGFGAEQIVDGSFYGQYFPVPEPNVSAFLIIGAGSLLLGKWRWQRH